MDITISASSIGGNAGPFTITDNLSNTLATGVTRSQILAGYTILGVNNSVTSVTLTSTGICTNQTVIPISGLSPTPTPTPPANIIYWNYQRADPAVGAGFTITKNGSPVVSTTAISDSGQFSYTPGDSIVATSTANVKTVDYTGVCVYDVGFNTILFSDNQTDADSQVSFTTTAGGYNIDGSQANTQPPTTCIVA